METGEHHSKAKTIWLLIILFIFAVSNTIWGLLYIKQSGENQQVSSQVATLSSEKTDLDAKIKKLEVAQAEKVETQKEEDATKWREIPELGVKFKVTDKNKDLTYHYIQTTNNPEDLEYIQVAFKSTFSQPIDDQENPYEIFPYTAVIAKYPQNRLKDFNYFGTTNISEYEKDVPGSVKKIGQDTYVMTVPDGGSLNPRAKDAATKLDIVRETLSSITATN